MLCDNYPTQEPFVIQGHSHHSFARRHTTLPETINEGACAYLGRVCQRLLILHIYMTCSDTVLDLISKHSCWCIGYIDIHQASVSYLNTPGMPPHLKTFSLIRSSFRGKHPYPQSTYSIPWCKLHKHEKLYERYNR